MRKAIVTRVAVILIATAIAPIGTAAARDGAAPSDRAGSQAAAADQNQVVLRRDGDRAVPFETAPIAAAAHGRFHWGDALVGAAGAYALIVLASGALVVTRRRRPTSASGPATGVGSA